MRGFTASSPIGWSPVFALPVNQMCWWSFCQTFPPNITVISQTNVCKDHILIERVDTVLICLAVSSRSYAEVARLWVNCKQTSFASNGIFAWLDPSNVITNSGNFPTLESLWRNHHGEVGFATRRWECGCDVIFLTFR